VRHLLYLNKFLWRYRNLLIIGSAFIVIANLFALYPAEFVRKAFDAVLLSVQEGSQKSDKIHYTILKYGGLIVSFSILKGVFMFFMRQTIIVMSRKIEFDLKNEIYQQYQSLSMSFYKRNKTGDLMNRISEDVSKVRMYLGPVLMYGINILILFYLVISKMLSISSTLTLYVLIPLPILAVLVYFVSSNINKRGERVQEQLSQLTTISQESFSGIKIIKSFVNQANTWKVFLESCKEYTKKQIQLVKIEAVFFPLIITMIGMSTIFTIYIGGIESFKGNITTGNIAEFIIYINMLAWPVASVGWITSIVQRAAASQKRINDFLLIEPEIQNKTKVLTPITGNINFKNVSLTYDDTNIIALNNVSFTIKEGSSLGVFGKTGSGKSTIASLLCRLYNTTKGDIVFGKTNIKDLNLFELRSSIGYIPQDGYLFSGSIKENIAFTSNKVNKKKVSKAAAEAEILDEIEKFTDGFATIIGERGVKISGGQRQRLAIARTFYKNPKLFIFDDCLSAIDATKEHKILKNLHLKKKGKTSIIISHRIATIKDADHIIVLEEGKIVEQGDHQSLLKNRGFYYKVNKSQNNLT
jgi:ATP-binding cassette, subfamily B, multidrug efflux pump